MDKVKVQNVRTGKISEITRIAWEQLKKGGHAKNFDLIEAKPKPKINFKVEAEVDSKPEEVLSEGSVSEEIEEKPKSKKSKLK
jgi:hypothetical protein